MRCKSHCVHGQWKSGRVSQLESLNHLYFVMASITLFEYYNVGMSIVLYRGESGDCSFTGAKY